MRSQFSYNEKVSEIIASKDKIINEFKKQLVHKKEELIVAERTIQQKDRLLSDVKIEI